MKYLKLYEEFNTDIKYSISWQGPTDVYIFALKNFGGGKGGGAGSGVSY